jgi:hypothetical protein
MPVLDERTIADLILDRLPSRAQAQLFLLDFERLVFRDFSIYNNKPRNSPEVGDEQISDKYFGIIEEMIRSDQSETEPSELVNLLQRLKGTRSSARLNLVKEQPDRTLRLIRYFPQNPFSLVAGAFFKAYLKGNDCVPLPFRRLDGGVCAATLKDVEKIYGKGDGSVYWRECGAFAWWLTRCFVEIPSGWLYIAPIIVDRAFHGLLYHYAEGPEPSAALKLAEAIQEVQNKFHERRYALTFDAVRLIGNLEDPLDAFLAGLAKYENIAVAIHWARGRKPTVYVRDFPDAKDGLAALAFRQLPWSRANNPEQYIVCDRSPLEGKLQTGIPVPHPLPYALKEEVKRQKPTQSRQRMKEVLRKELAEGFRKVSLPLKFRLGIPGHLVGFGPGERYLELFYSEPAPGSLKTKLYALVPPLAEVVRFALSAATRAQLLNRIVASLLFHEIRNTLITIPGARELGQVAHINTCLSAYGLLASEMCLRQGWDQLHTHLTDYFKREQVRIKIEPWPSGLEAIAASWQLLYVVVAELIHNALARHAKSITVTLNRVNEPDAVALGVLSDQNVDVQRLQRRVQEWWKAGFAPDAPSGGLRLIIQLLRTLDAPKAPPLEVRKAGRGLHVLCYFPIRHGVVL